MPLKRVTVDGLDRICFHHFKDDDLERLRHRLSRLSIRDEKPAIAEIEDCVVTPGIIRRKKVFGVYDRENQLVAGSALPRGRRNVGAQAQQEDLQGAVPDQRSAYYLGWGAGHYGHFLLETFCRAWAWEDHGEGRIPILQKRVPEFARALYRLVSDALADRIEISRVPTRFASVLVPEAGFTPKREAYTEYKAFCMRIGERVRGNDKTSGRPLYLSRAGLDPDRRRILVGETALERLLRREGFRVVRPETMPIAKQIALFNRHEWIVAPMGSACHSRLFAARPTKMVMLCTSDFTENFVLCDWLSEGTTDYVNVLSGERAGFSEPVALNEEALLAYLKDLGLVRPRAAFDATLADHGNREEAL